jgi:hypothetical protein
MMTAALFLLAFVCALVALAGWSILCFRMGQQEPAIKEAPRPLIAGARLLAQADHHAKRVTRLKRVRE